MGRRGPGLAAAMARSSATRIVAAVVVLVVVSTAVFAAGTTHSGASTPEAAVEDLVEALEAGDVVGVLESLAPSEQRVLSEPLDELAGGLEAAGVVGGDEGLDGLIPGVTVEVEGLELSSEELDEQVTFVLASGGTVRVTVDPVAVVDPAVRDDLAARADVALEDGLVWERDLAVDPLVFGVLDEGGGYHVSVAYTAAEQARRSAGAPLPDVETRPDAVGSNTPEEVVTDLLSAIEARFPLRVAELVSPYDGRVLYDYATLWLPGVQRAADQVVADEAAGRPGWSFRVDDVAVHAEGEGDERRVVIDRLDATIVDGYADEHVRVQVSEDGCTSWTTTGGAPGQLWPAPGPPVDVRSVCPGGGWTDGGGGPADPPGAALVDLMTLDGLGAGQPTVTVIEREGRWTLSPTRTVLDSLAEGLGRAGAQGAGDWSAGLVALVLRFTDGDLAVRHG